MRFKIPANTELEDKIVPFLTIRQLIILCIWATLWYFVFHVMHRLWYLPIVWWTIDFFIMWFVLCSAFLKINHLEFHRWLSLLIARWFVPQKRFFNNWLIWWQNFDVLNISSTWNKIEKKNKTIKKEDKKNDFDKIKNEIFWNKEKNFFNYDDDFDKLEQIEFEKRFWWIIKNENRRTRIS